MKLFILCSLVSVSFGAGLENYLPPSRNFPGSGLGPASQFGPGNRYSGSGGRFGSQSSSNRGLSTSFDQPEFSRRSFGQSNSGPQIRILRLNNDNDGSGNYRFEYETENQISRQEVGEQRLVGNELVSNVQGSYSYTAPDGQHITVNYVADENGFRAQGDHLPTQPAISTSGRYQGGSSFETGNIQNRQYLAPSFDRGNQEYPY